MSRLFYHVMQDNAGNLLFDVSGTMRVAGSGTLATIYGDEELTVVLPNPMTNHPSFGSFKCFLGAGAYDFYMAKSGYTFETLTGVQGHGSMAQQDANAVAITGGTISVGSGAFVPSPGMAAISLADASGDSIFGVLGQIAAGGGSNRWFLYSNGDAPSYLSSFLFVGSANPTIDARCIVTFPKDTLSGIKLRQTVNDTGGGFAMLFANASNAFIGSISTTGSGVSFNQTSDVRVKTDVAPLEDATGVIRALRPVRHRWRQDGTRGYGFLAHEVQALLPEGGVVTGTPDALDAQGQILPQQMDASKLVPWLTAALQDTLAQLDTLTARVAALEGA